LIANSPLLFFPTLYLLYRSIVQNVGMCQLVKFSKFRTRFKWTSCRTEITE
jgi:hypothetical protein